MVFKKSGITLASIVLALAALLQGARAQIPSGGASEPLYPQVIVETDTSYSDNVALAAYRASLLEAADALIQTPQGKLYDPAPVLALLADSVEVLVARGRGAPTHQQDFVSLGQFSPGKALEMLGRISNRKPTTDPLVQQRYGMGAIRQMVGEPTVGASPWLDGRICTASYGRLTWPQWWPLWDAMRMEQEQWVIAAGGFPDSGDAWPKQFQMVPVSPEQKRSGGSLGIIAPNLGGQFFELDEVYFTPYLNNHLCFEKRGDGWKVTANAYRLD